MLLHALTANRALDMSVKVWFATALVGQLLFAIYIGFRYAIPVYMGTPEDMNMSPHITGYVPGDFSGNSMLLIHVFGAAILSACGMLQLIPALRARFPRVHRINGRIFFVMGLAGALTGLYLTWLRGTRLSDIGAIGISINGVLIVVAIYYAWRFAVEKKFAQHMRFAVHAFFLVNAVWTLRLFLMGWFLTTQGYGNNRTMDGPSDIAISFACYLLPMFLAELYFWAKQQSSAKRQWVVFGAMTLGCVITVIGVVAASMILWLPRIGTALGIV
ncbi:DUF2306 domain-containing protein [Alteromonas sp. ASW11-36]|uniref:DUF2306 domain-containing protein n=1 Tax=Alteromonas arenosi TaxID=3055817 RepID=A0ABT7SZD1_9ALTE|nr:DUF2306 domain-containing protein [Alteromonas sp. ASW11-36]MDM7861546.1 DUF2306 domain-containing protein [Alteromonas sp. ASW11-36]